MLTLAELKEIMPHAKNPEEHVDPLNSAMSEFGISTLHEQAMFIAQIAHETGELQWLEELASGAAYEGRADLGNTHQGDGRRFKGRGDFQLTGRSNYEFFGKLLKMDLINNPEEAATPKLAARIAGAFWHLHNLNPMAEAQDLPGVTRRINGGLNGLADRAHYYSVARAVLGRTISDMQLKPVQVMVGDEQQGLNGFWRAGHVYLPLRDLASLAGWGILKAEANLATVRTKDGANHQVPFLLEEGKGFVNAADLFGQAIWNPVSRVLSVG